MPRLETDIKLGKLEQPFVIICICSQAKCFLLPSIFFRCIDFKDVLIRPKRSTLKSRSEVDVTRTYHFRNAKCSWTGVVSYLILTYILFQNQDYLR